MGDSALAPSHEGGMIPDRRDVAIRDAPESVQGFQQGALDALPQVRREVSACGGKCIDRWLPGTSRTSAPPSASPVQVASSPSPSTALT